MHNIVPAASRSEVKRPTFTMSFSDMRKICLIQITASLLILLSCEEVFGALAFPGAEGFGAYAEGGRGGDVYIVTNTEDSGPGSLRDGIASAAGPRTIVFAVAGIIQLQSNLKLDKHYIPIAVQTPPGSGI